MTRAGCVAAVGHVTVLDGGTGRELARIGAPFSQPLWSAQALLEGLDYVRRVHESYVAAGAEVITTNTYALVPFHLGDELYSRDGARLTALAASIAREVADRHPGVRVAGCLPPVLGSYQPELFTRDAARPLLDVLVREQAPFVDLWLAETQSSIAEVQFVREVLDAHGQSAPLWISFTLEDEGTHDQPWLRSGELVIDAAKAAERLGAEVLLFNCSQPEVMGPAIAAASSAIDLPIGVYANSFVVEVDESAANAGMHDIREDVTPEAYLELARGWVAAGASLVGGCCGIGPEHISALSAHLSAG
jgi:S-methylmethionine-dependent homocysteine/selenocysteine methylase